MAGKLGIALLIFGGIALAAIASGAFADATNLDVISPMPTPYALDTTADILTVSQPEEISPEVREVAIADEITDMARDMSGNQLAQAQDATGALTVVSVAGYTTIAGMQAGNNIRDIAIVAGVVIIAFLLMKNRNNKEQ